MKKIVNKTHLEGYLFAHTLELKVSGENAKTPGVEFISGTLEIATDDAGLNVVPVSFRYVTAKTKAGKANATYTTLLNIINSTGKTFQDCGTAAMKLRVDTALGVNDFYSNDGELITYKINDGGFVHATPSFGEVRNHFEVDMLITSTVMKEADEDRDLPEMLIVKGATFNFMGSLLPIEVVVKDSNGIKYFENLEASASEPVFLKVWGSVVCSTIDTQTVEESAFGEPAVKTSTRKLREWVITGASTVPYEYGDDAVLTSAEVEKAVADREVYLADIKKRYDEYMASKGGSSAAPKAAPGGFNF